MVNLNCMIYLLCTDIGPSTVVSNTENLNGKQQSEDEC